MDLIWIYGTVVTAPAMALGLVVLLFVFAPWN